MRKPARKDEVWGDYRFAVVGDSQEADGLKVIDLGAGHSSSNETLCGRVIAALKSEALLNDLSAPATSNGTGRRRSRIPVPGRLLAFVRVSSMGRSRACGSGRHLEGQDCRIRHAWRFRPGVGEGHRWWVREGVVHEMIAPDEVAFDAHVFLLRRDVVEAFKSGTPPEPKPEPGATAQPSAEPVTEPGPLPGFEPASVSRPGASDSSA